MLSQVCQFLGETFSGVHCCTAIYRPQCITQIIDFSVDINNSLSGSLDDVTVLKTFVDFQLSGSTFSLQRFDALPPVAVQLFHQLRLQQLIAVVDFVDAMLILVFEELQVLQVLTHK